jgi:hypothetical protein
VAVITIARNSLWETFGFSSFFFFLSSWKWFCYADYSAFRTGCGVTHVTLRLTQEWDSSVSLRSSPLISSIKVGIMSADRNPDVISQNKPGWQRAMRK